MSASNETCPWCGEPDYDLIGLKSHVMKGDCKPFDEIAVIRNPFDGSMARSTAAATQEVINWAQSVLTALNVGDVQSGSKLHLKLREVMIAYRDSTSEPASQ